MTLNSAAQPEAGAQAIRKLSTVTGCVSGKTI
jgi:hypothetical protein